jgi:YebC/PmpR family DNA-binding regulatory protein
MGRAFEYRRAAKEKRWDRMSKVFPKLARSITVAARQGGPDPETNARLRTAIMNAKAQNMPKDNVESAIRRAAGKDGANFDEAFYEGKGPHGTLLIVECATDNPNRTISNLKIHFNKGGGQLVQSGSLEFLFTRQAVIEFTAPAEADLEEIELALIDAGLEELEAKGNTVFARGDYTRFGSLSQAIEELGCSIIKATLQRVPVSPIDLSEEQMTEVENLIDRLEDDEDVQAVFTNIA